MTNPVSEWMDSFGNHLTRGVFNNADLASIYAFSPERYRFFRNGSKVLLRYEDIDNYAYFDDKRPGEEDVFILSPDAGDTLKLRTAERFRYTVNFVSEFTQALGISQDLENPNDRVTVFFDTSPLGDLSDGYFIEYTGDHDPLTVDLYEKRNDSVIDQKYTVDIDVALTVFNRLAGDYNWYNVGEWNTEQTHTDDRGQRNRRIGTLSTEDGDTNAGPTGRGPISGNGRIGAEVEADASTTDLELYLGSSSFTTLGAAGSSVKGKGAEAEDLSVSTTGSWVPLFVMRADPDRPFVNLQLDEVEITVGSGKLMAISADSSNVLNGSANELSDSDFSPPEEHSGTNSVVEVTDGTVVDQFPDNSGSTTTSAANPGGYQLGFDTTRTSGPGDKSQRTSGIQEKHGVYGDEYAVFIAKPSTTDNFNVAYTTSQDW